MDNEGSKNMEERYFMEEINGRKKYKCKRCNKRSGNRPGIINHILKKHNDSGISSLKCSICLRNFKTKFALETHMNRKTLCTGTLKCHYCRRIFKHKQKFILHMENEIYARNNNIPNKPPNDINSHAKNDVDDPVLHHVFNITEVEIIGDKLIYCID